MRYHYTGDEIDFYHEYQSRPSYKERSEMLMPLIDHLTLVDAARMDLFQNSISLSKLHHYIDLLRQPIEIGKRYRGQTFSLAERNLERILFHENLWDIKLNVRKGYMGFPRYYLCEYRELYGRNYGIILADYYQSNDYELTDPRFSRILFYGHETNFIRMSPFREKVTEFITGKNPAGADGILIKVGSYFLQGAWHEDQFTAWLVSDALGLQKFSEAIEIIYFLLGSDFTETRDNYDGDVEKFFTLVYPRKSLLGIIKKIGNSMVEDMVDMEHIAREWYRSLNSAFSGLLKAEISWGVMEKIPLYKIIYSNIYRLEMVFPLPDEGDGMIREHIDHIEGISLKFIHSLDG